MKLPLSLSYWVALIGMEADYWLMDLGEIEIVQVEKSLLNSDELRVGCRQALESLPTASAMFNLALLTKSKVAELKSLGWSESLKRTRL